MSRGPELDKINNKLEDLDLDKQYENNFNKHKVIFCNFLLLTSLTIVVVYEHNSI